MRSLLLFVAVLAGQPAHGAHVTVCQGGDCYIKCVNNPLDGESACNSQPIHINNAGDGKDYILVCKGKDACNSVDFTCTNPFRCFYYCLNVEDNVPSCNSLTVQQGIRGWCESGACNSVESVNPNPDAGAIVFPPDCTTARYQQDPNGGFSGFPFCFVLCLGDGACNSENYRVFNANGQVYTKLICFGKDACNSVTFRCDDNDYCAVKCLYGDPACNSLTTPRTNGVRMPVYCIPDKATACNSVSGGMPIDYDP